VAANVNPFILSLSKDGRIYGQECWYFIALYKSYRAQFNNEPENEMGFSVPHLLVVLAIVVLVFGTKRLKNVGADLGDAIKGFRKAVKDSESLEDKEAELLHGELVSEIDRSKA
jgi:sec-independent protein translocase protein TatA